MARRQKIASAVWIEPRKGQVSLCRDWTKKRDLPPLFWGKDRIPLELKLQPPYRFGAVSGYFTHDDYVCFIMPADLHAQLEWQADGLYVGGDFNNWAESIGNRSWKMEPVTLDGEAYYLLNVSRSKVFSKRNPEFKFVTGKGQWLETPAEVPGAVYNSMGVRNRVINSAQTGYHVFEFESPKDIRRIAQARIFWIDEGGEEVCLMMPGRFLLDLDSEIAQGAFVDGEHTVFRLFAPRASMVSVVVYRQLDASDALQRDGIRADGKTWEIRIPGNWTGAYYHYLVDSEHLDCKSAFNPTAKILDPWALATAGPAGPGIVVSRERFHRFNPVPFKTPDWQDLVICEAHVRDLCAHAPIALTDKERLGFSGLKKWVEHPDFYLTQMGFNAVELQPIQQNDALSVDEYHWGYMTTNYFAPNSHYALHPEFGSQIEEFRELVDAFHRRGIAVILDVVYNHVGEPNMLQLIDKHYYFDLDDKGGFMNWSGCGNTLRCNTPMASKLIIESLTHLIREYHVDGFRFDLAELIGIEVLKKIEVELKAVKPDVILIAEPWSFRGHIGHALKTTGFASWNDGYREFIRNFVCGNGNVEGLSYFIKGSMDYLSAWPAQSVNYVESHDDACWMDKITENAHHDALFPTAFDRRRTHLMVSILMVSIGIPLLSAGQDMLRTKRGHHNTYQRGDLNAIDFMRATEFSHTQDYFRAWIAFRLSDKGKLLRLYEKPSEGYFEVFSVPGYSTLGICINADQSFGTQRLFYAVNPHIEWVAIALSGVELNQMTQIADHERFCPTGLAGAVFSMDRNNESLFMPPLSCALWIG
jgi:pullulanase/glycogen debranching enzyme